MKRIKLNFVAGVVVIGAGLMGCSGSDVSVSARQDALDQAAFYRVNKMNLVDPHVSAGAMDLTGFVNEAVIKPGILRDKAEPNDGLLDISMVIGLRPENKLSVVYPSCTAPFETTVCTRSETSVAYETPYLDVTEGSCLGMVEGTSGNTPNLPVAPCFVAELGNIALNLGVFSLPLNGAVLGASYATDAEGKPMLDSGLIRGFLSKSAANNVAIPDYVAKMIFATKLGQLLKDKDLDVGPNGEAGWLFYINFVGNPVSYVENLPAPQPAQPVIAPTDPATPAQPVNP